MREQTTQDRRPVMVTTVHRGVFAGLLVEDHGETVVIEDARMCVYWDASTHGVLGLAQHGPGPSCRISPAAPRLTLRGVTALADLTPQAWERWRAEPWG